MSASSAPRRFDRARRVHRRVPAAIDHDAAAETRWFACVDITQERDGVEHAHRIARRNIDMLADARADGDEDRVEATRRLFRPARPPPCG